MIINLDTTKITERIKAVYVYINKYHLAMMFLATAVIGQDVVIQRLQMQVQTNKIMQDAVNDYNRAYTKYAYWNIMSNVYPDDTAVVDNYQRGTDAYSNTEKRLGVVADSLGVVVVIAEDTVSHAKYVRDSLAKVQKNNR